jgi:hypothetical protein
MLIRVLTIGTWALAGCTAFLYVRESTRLAEYLRDHYPALWTAMRGNIDPKSPGAIFVQKRPLNVLVIVLGGWSGHSVDSDTKLLILKSRKYLVGFVLTFTAGIILLGLISATKQ